MYWFDLGSTIQCFRLLVVFCNDLYLSQKEVSLIKKKMGAILFQLDPGEESKYFF